MLEAGKTEQVAAEMRNYNLAVLGTSESRWTGSGQRRLATGEHGKLSPGTHKGRGRPRNTWRRDLQADAKSMGHSWGQLERLAQDREAWRTR
nr:hypothetical protein BaRGS_030488 [Batillaria attramentaria]